MVFPDFDPVIFHLGPIAIRWYALAYVAGILIGWWYVGRLAKKEALWGPRAPVASRDQIDDLVLWVTIGVIAGGRIGSMLFYNTAALWEHPLEIFQIWKGGMSFHGGLIGVMLAMTLFARIHKMPVLKVSDLIAPCVPVGLFFGRIANFINSELWGRPTELPWGIRPHADEVARHPSQLYEAALEGVVLFIILRLATHQFGQLKRPGAVTGLFLLGYGVFRTMVEFVRSPDAGLDHLPLGLTMGMILSAPMWLAGLWLFVRSRGPLTEKPAPALEEVAPQPATKAAPSPTPEAAPKPEPKPQPKPEPKPKPVAQTAAKKAVVPKAAAPKAAAPKPATPKPASEPKPAAAPAAKKPAAKTTAAKPKAKPAK